MNLIFDLDGTLVDSAPGILTTLTFVLAEHGLKYADQLTPKLIGPPLREMLVELSGGSSDQILLDSMENTFKRHYDNKGVFETAAYDGAHQMLMTLKNQGHLLFVATNKRMSPTRALMKHFSWDHYFLGVYSLDSFKPVLKDKSSLLRKIIQTHALILADTIYIGDRPEDSDAAIKSDLKFLHARWGYGGEVPNGSQSVLETPSEIYVHVN